MPQKKSPKPERERLFTIDEMSVLLQVDRRKLVEWIQHRRIPFVVVNRDHIRFKMSDIAEWIGTRNKPKGKFRFT
ncbi:MAG TPA: helix-turn-helix domain-containing protein [bacterium]|nr:helix-turn-helix domain-containing protein [bacterium]